MSNKEEDLWATVGVPAGRSQQGVLVGGASQAWVGGQKG